MSDMRNKSYQFYTYCKYFYTRVAVKTHDKTPKLIVHVPLLSNTTQQTLSQTMTDDQLRTASTCGMIGACVSKLRVVSWITIDWQNSRPHRMRTGNGSAAVRSGETHISGRLSTRSQGPP